MQQTFLSFVVKNPSGPGHLFYRLPASFFQDRTCFLHLCRVFFCSSPLPCQHKLPASVFHFPCSLPHPPVAYPAFSPSGICTNRGKYSLQNLLLFDKSDTVNYSPRLALRLKHVLHRLHISVTEKIFH